MSENKTTYGSTPERAFEFQLNAHDILYSREYRAIPNRKFRFDFLIFPDILIEINGGTFQHMGHSTGMGIQRDYDKHNLAVLAGFRVLMFTTEDIGSGRAIKLINEITNG